MQYYNIIYIICVINSKDVTFQATALAFEIDNQGFMNSDTFASYYVGLYYHSEAAISCVALLKH